MRRSLDALIEMADDARKREREEPSPERRPEPDRREVRGRRDYICPVCDHASSRDPNVKLCPAHELDYEVRAAAIRSRNDPIAEYDNAASLGRAGVDVAALQGDTEDSPSRTRTYDHSINRSSVTTAPSENTAPGGAHDGKIAPVKAGLDHLTPDGGPKVAQSVVEAARASRDLIEASPRSRLERRLFAELSNEDEVEYRLRYYGDPCLSRKSQVVRVVTPAITRVFEALERIAAEHKGLGLAANQIGSNAAVAVMRIGDTWLRLVNPLIVQHGFENQDPEYLTLREGSLSIPGFTIRTTRTRRIVFGYQNERMEDCVRELADTEARCAQHLVDQLKGIMIVGPEHSRQVRRQCERIATKARGWRRS